MEPIRNRLIIKNDLVSVMGGNPASLPVMQADFRLAEPTRTKVDDVVDAVMPGALFTRIAILRICGHTSPHFAN